MKTVMPPSERNTVGRPIEILLVEHGLEEARLAIEILRGEGVPCRISLLCDGEEALEFLHRRGCFRRAPKPDVILLDMHLPKKDGREVLAEIKVIDRLCRIPVLVLVESRAQEETIRGEGLGVQGFLGKPLAAKPLLAMIRSLRKDLLADVVGAQSAWRLSQNFRSLEDFGSLRGFGIRS